MFCFQCEQTRDNKGCMTVGVCGKTPEVASLQDLLIHATKGVSIYAKGARDLGTSATHRNFFPIQEPCVKLESLADDDER
jgi:hydroxylamine reductase